MAIRVVFERQRPCRSICTDGRDRSSSAASTYPGICWLPGAPTAPDRIRWIIISQHGIPDWAGEGEVRTTEVPFRTTDGEAQIVAVRDRGWG